MDDVVSSTIQFSPLLSQGTWTRSASCPIYLTTTMMCGTCWEQWHCSSSSSWSWLLMMIFLIRPERRSKYSKAECCTETRLLKQPNDSHLPKSASSWHLGLEMPKSPPTKRRRKFSANLNHLEMTWASKWQKDYRFWHLKCQEFDEKNGMSNSQHFKWQKLNRCAFGKNSFKRRISGPKHFSL